MWPGFLCSPFPFFWWLVVNEIYDIQGCCRFSVCFFSFSLLPRFHTSQLFCFIYFLLPLLLFTFFVLLLELLEEKDTMHPSLLSHGVWAKLHVSCWWLSLLLKPSWHSFILVFFRNRSRAVIQRPLGHLSFGSGLLYPLSSHLACAFQAVLSSTHPLPHLPVVMDPFQQQRRKVESVPCCEPRTSTIHLFRGESF